VAGLHFLHLFYGKKNIVPEAISVSFCITSLQLSYQFGSSCRLNNNKGSIDFDIGG
jgi:hypothetical protein